ncbi:MerR family transcriptional regulator [Spiribacter halobius]|uniref:MerR family transcriptional regulator n=1 Tax=Sediminicurvatus halobius TaxID=2182432 RepID=A0A2U2N627_9GAMM|nr:helix-turn-helix domain-containing protein [Spiribacter halobius]PWG64518.1 MerR family transcriptional regulator [Spiribacter halobius]UEX79161.1 helix-turn-helix domain-containing protein [Spiribacter halobius]
MERRIGQLARETGCQVETIRYYERIGVLPPAARASNNYRVYDDSHCRRLLFIRRMRDLGFSLEEVRALLRMIDGGNYTCAEVQALGQQHLNAVRDKIADLRLVEDALADLLGRCTGAETPDCSMLEALFVTCEATASNGGSAEPSMPRAGG